MASSRAHNQDSISGFTPIFTHGCSAVQSSSYNYTPPFLLRCVMSFLQSSPTNNDDIVSLLITCKSLKYWLDRYEVPRSVSSALLRQGERDQRSAEFPLRERGDIIVSGVSDRGSVGDRGRSYNFNKYKSSGAPIVTGVTREICRGETATVGGMGWREPRVICTDYEVLRWRANVRRACRKKGELSWLSPTLPQVNHKAHRVLLPSFPRSGNTLLRTLLEEIYGIVTGSDTRPDRNLSLRLSGEIPYERNGGGGGFVGEGCVQWGAADDEGVEHKGWVQVLKTHWPERGGWKDVFVPYQKTKVILLMRNPYDAIVSYFNLCVTNRHDSSVSSKVWAELRDFFRGFSHSEIKIWTSFHEFWLSKRPQFTDSNFHVVRFEDLISADRRVIVLENLVQFIEGVEVLDEVWKSKISTAVSRIVGGGGLVYKPRAGSSGPGKSLRMESGYDQEDVDVFSKIGGAILEQFGYKFDFTKPDLPFPAEITPLAPIQQVAAQQSGGFTINDGSELRNAEEQRYGRKMTNWRRSMTQNDSKPFETKNDK